MLAHRVYERTNGKRGWRYEEVKEGAGHRTGFLLPPFYIRRSESGALKWRKLAAQTFNAAKKEVETVDAALDAVRKGLTVAEVKSAAGQPVPVKTAVDSYLEQRLARPREPSSATGAR